tara:strand:- start:418 stop:1002 length:585 start_codon:yes stop_codon:yes gene_type:complete
METWGTPIDSLLDKIRLNCVQLTNRHIKNHLYYKGASAYFEVPTIILSVFAGSFSVGSDPFLHQELISVVNCIISMIITILTSVKLYMKITENSSQEQELAISFKSLALDIFKTLSLPEDKRGVDGMVYLNKVYGKYINLVENSAILNQMNKKDQLLVIDPRMLRGDGDSISSDDSPPHRNPMSVDKEFSEDTI